MNITFSIDTREPVPIRSGWRGEHQSTTSGGVHFLKKESEAAAEIGTNGAREYANWGEEFVDDALRFGDQSFQANGDWPAGTRNLIRTPAIKKV